MWIQSGFHHLCIHFHIFLCLHRGSLCISAPYRSAQGVQIKAEGGLMLSCLDLLYVPVLQITVNKKVLQAFVKAICLLFSRLRENKRTLTLVVHLANCNLSAGVYMYV